MPLSTSNLRSARLGLAALACFIVLAVTAWASPNQSPSTEVGSGEEADQLLPHAQSLNVTVVSPGAKHVVESRAPQSLNATGVIERQFGEGGVEGLEAQAWLTDLQSQGFTAIGIVGNGLRTEIKHNVNESAGGHEYAAHATQPSGLGEYVGERAGASAQSDEGQDSTNAPVQARMSLMQADFVSKIVAHFGLRAASGFIAHGVIFSGLMEQVVQAAPVAKDSCSAGCPSALGATGSASARDGSLAVSLIGMDRGQHFNPTAKEAASTGAPRAPKDLMITSPRICAALAVYELAAADDWGLRATVANTSLNAFRDASRVPDCAPGITKALTQNFQPERWQLSLDAADAVLSGSYQVSPAACVRANAVVPLSTADGKEPSTSPVLARAQCVMYDLAFIEVAP
ncbi:hypothetical protein MF545_00450 [Stenotrophomonas maltophilia]|nr:hypothetical protein [Stenotrophomonas maltophilia]